MEAPREFCSYWRCNEAPVLDCHWDGGDGDSWTWANSQLCRLHAVQVVSEYVREIVNGGATKRIACEHHEVLAHGD